MQAIGALLRGQPHRRVEPEFHLLSLAIGIDLDEVRQAAEPEESESDECVLDPASEALALFARCDQGLDFRIAIHEKRGFGQRLAGQKIASFVDLIGHPPLTRQRRDTNDGPRFCVAGRPGR